jgi:hypothetical protein
VAVDGLLAEAWLEISSMVLQPIYGPYMPRVTTDDGHLAMIELTES